MRITLRFGARVRRMIPFSNDKSLPQSHLDCSSFQIDK
jgi:hypothetical protein